MNIPMHRNATANVHQFSMIPAAEIPRSSFAMQKTLKTTFDSGYLVPIMVEEILPGDTFNVRMTAFARLATPIFPVMDNLWLESFFFFVPNRLVWTNWVRFMGEQDSPGDSIAYTIPTMTSPAGGYATKSLQDLMGLPTAGQVAGGNTVTHSTLPLRAYNLIWNKWFRDENLQNAAVVDTGDGPDTYTNYSLLRRGKRHDYFTSCLPWTQKGGIAVGLPLGGTAIVKTSASPGFTGAQTAINWNKVSGGSPSGATLMGTTALGVGGRGGTAYTESEQLYPNNLYADLSTATSVTINAIRLAFQTQKLLERDARGGSRYIEIIRQHFGVISPDARLQRPEYLGGGKTPIVINPIVQTAQTGLTGGSTPLGTLAAVGSAVASGHGFTQSFVEHGFVIGLVHVHADLTYQQGLRRLWSRSTRYDHYFPAFAMLGEQAVLQKEIYCDGGVNDTLVFGYQERWAELRYNPNQIVGLFRSTSAGTIDPWHLAQKFAVAPTLNSTFIQDTPPLSRILAVGSGADGQQLLMDAFFDIKAARPLPMYSVPGLVDHF